MPASRVFVFADPEIAAVGLTAYKARRGGIDIAAAEISVVRKHGDES